MAQSYYYIVGALPTLRCGCVPEWTLAELDAYCREMMSEADYRKFQTVSMDCAAENAFGLWEKYLAFETELRNGSLAFRRQTFPDALDYRRPAADYFSEQQQVLAEAEKLDPLAAAQRLDQLRWSYLDHLEAAHHFEFDNVAAYKLRMLIAENWRGRTAEAGRQGLDAVLEAVDHGCTAPVPMEEMQ